MTPSTKITPKTRIYNPITRAYYRIRTKDTSRGNKGSIIIGRWHSTKKSKKK